MAEKRSIKNKFIECSLCNFESEKENFFVPFANKDGENNILMNKIKTYDKL